MAGSEAGREGMRRARRGKPLQPPARQFHRLVLVMGDQAHGVLSRLPGLGRCDDGRLGMDPGRVVEPGRRWLAHAQGLRRVGDRLAVLAQGREGKAPAEVGVGVRGVEPDGPLEVAQGRAGRSLTR